MSINLSYSITNVDQTKISEAISTQLNSKSNLLSKYSIHHLSALEERRFQVSDEKKVNVIGNAFFNPTEKNIPHIVNTSSGASYAVIMNKMTESEEVVALTIKDSVIAYYDKQYRVIYMPYSLADFDEESRTDIYIAVLTAFYEQILKEMRHPDSWIENAAVLRPRIDEMLKRDNSAHIESLKEKMENAASRIQEFQAKLKREFDNHTKTSRDLEIAENTTFTFDNFYQGLDLIAQHPGVSELMVKNDLVTVHIDNVYAHAFTLGKERRYYIGNMKVQMNIANTEIKFFGDNPRKSHWSEKDPHPHVSGDSGNACLGNVSASIAELCSQREVYPLFLMCLDFLENANPEDSAGKNIVRWDEVDENGKVIQKGFAPGKRFHCNCCQKTVSTSRSSERTVYTKFEDGRLDGRERWCTSCRDEKAVINDHVGEYVAKEIESAVNAHHDPQSVAVEQAEVAVEAAGTTTETGDAI